MSIATQLDMFRDRDQLDWGASGRCDQLGKHHDCAHSVGGPQEHGVHSPEGIWRCSCPCHSGPEPQVYAPTDKWLKAAKVPR